MSKKFSKNVLKFVKEIVKFRVGGLYLPQGWHQEFSDWVAESFDEGG